MMPTIGRRFGQSPEKNGLKPQVNVSVKNKLNPRKQQPQIESIEEEETPGNAFMGKASRERLNTTKQKPLPVQKFQSSLAWADQQ